MKFTELCYHATLKPFRFLKNLLNFSFSKRNYIIPLTFILQVQQYYKCIKKYHICCHVTSIWHVREEQKFAACIYWRWCHSIQAKNEAIQYLHKSSPATEDCVDGNACKDWVEEWLDMTIDEPLKEDWVVRLVVVACWMDEEDTSSTFPAEC